MRKFKELGLKNKWLPKKNGKVYRYWLSVLALIRRIRYKTKVTIARSKYPKTLKWVLISAPAVIVLFVLGFIFIGRPNYNLSPAASLIVGSTNKRMLGELKYSSKTSSYVLNQTGINSAGSGVGSSRSIGGSESSGAYSAILPKDVSKGITIYDDVSNLSFSMTPNMPLANAKRVDGHIVYPGKNGLQAVYTLLGNGLKEDLVLNHPSGNTASYSYTIKLPSYLQAKENGANAIGIYSADSALFGNISYGSSGSQQEVANARLKSPKTNLVFELLPPTVNQSDGKLDGTASEAKTTLKLKGNTIIVSVSGLAKLSYPVSIDPSVLVTSASFTTGNNEGDVSDTSGNLSEAGLDGGSVSAGWNYTEGSVNNGNTFVSGFTDARWGQAAVAYNGYLYVMGGVGPASGSDCTAAYNTCNGVQYAAINSNGTIGTWAYTTSFAEARAGESAVAYNGYLYIIGGVSGTSANDCTAAGDLGPGSYNCNGVQYAQINSNGTVGTWNYTIGGGNNGSTFVSGFTQARAFFSAVVYNGYLYIAGGESGSSANDCTAAGDFCNGVQDIIINANGTIDAWSYTANGIQYGSSYSSGFTLSRYGLSALAYNGYLYVMGGLGASSNNDCTAAGTYCNGVQYAPINSNGSIGSWAYTTSFTQARSGQSAVVYNGYLYVMGGVSGSSANDCTATSDYCNGVQYAPINSNGTIGTWAYTTSFTQARYDQSAIVYNGYLYITGGRSGTSANDCTAADPYGAYLCNGNQYAPIDSAGVLSSWASTTTPLISPGWSSSAVYNGYVYQFGGYTSAYVSTVEYAPINSNGSLGTWVYANSMANPVELTGSVAYNGYMYVLGGKNSGGAAINNTYYALICTGNNNGVSGCSSTAGSLGTWTSATNYPTATDSVDTVAYNGYLYGIGGYNSSSSTAVVDYALICTGTNSGTGGCSSTAGSLGTWVATSSLLNPTYFASSAVYNGYVYELGGYSTEVEYALICTGTNSGTDGCSSTAGSLGTWTNTTVLPASVNLASTEVWNGYMYELISTGSSTSVEYAPINSNGTIGSWTATNSSFPESAQGDVAAVYNGYIYELTAYSGTSYYAEINNGGPGTIASWNTDTSNPLPQALYGSATAVYNGYIYILGGYNSSGPINYVYYAPISNAGVIGAWTSDTSLSTGAFTNARAGLGVAVYNGYLYIVGGSQPSTQQSVTYSTAGSGNWTAPAGVTSVEVQAWGGGGGGDAGVAGGGGGGGGGGGEYAAEPSLAVTPGNLYAYSVGSAGTNAGQCTTAGTGGSSTFAGNSVTVTAYGGSPANCTLGGAGGSGSTNTINYGGGSGGNGGTKYSPTGGNGGGSGGTSLVGNSASTVAVTGGGPGGAGGGSGGSGAAPVSGPSGGGGGSYPGTTAGAGWAGQITITWTPSPYLNDVQYAALNSNGSLSAPSTCAGGLAAGNSIWCEATAFTTARTGLSTAVYNGNLYILGGQAASSTGGCTSTGDYCNDVQYDSINANGSLGGTWTDDTSLSGGAFSTARSNLAATAYDGYLYIMGGSSGASAGGCIATSNYCNDVQYASIASNGSLSEPSSCNALASGNSIWCSTTWLPTARQGLNAVAYNGYLYTIGGQASSATADCTGTGDYCNGVYYAPINNNGSIGAWTPTTSISTATDGAASAVYDGYVFYIGGSTSSSGSSSVYYAGLDSMPRIGYYSILLDLSGSSSLDPTPTEIMALGSNSGNPGIGGLSGPGTGGVYVSYNLASNGCSIFTSPSTLATITELNTAYPINNLVSNACANGSTNFRYVWVRYVLDDSQTASFPDVNGNHITVTGISLYYAAAQGDRLRGGSTLTNGVQQPLYAPPVTGAP